MSFSQLKIENALPIADAVFLDKPLNGIQSTTVTCAQTGHWLS